jgi:hypothetical protein
VIIWKVVGLADFYRFSVISAYYKSHKKCELFADSIARYFLFFTWCVCVCGEGGWEAGYWKWLNLPGERFFLSFGQLAWITMCGGSAFCSNVCISVTMIESL